MKITDVEAIYLRLPEIKERNNSSQDILLIKIATGSGIIGWGRGGQLAARRQSCH